MPKRVLSVESINKDLQSACIGVQLLQRGSKLSLQATLPPKPGSKKQKPHQQQIALGLYANLDGLEQARAAALDLSAQLARSTFDWKLWSDKGSIASGVSCAAWIERYRSYQVETACNEQEGAEDLWWRRRFYNLALKWLPADAELTAEVLLEAVRQPKPNTRSRQVCCQILQAFADWCGVEVNLKPYIGNYSPKKVKRRIIPTEADIIETVEGIKNPAWRWVAAMMATYGLRDHECWFTSLEWEDVPDLGRVLVAYVNKGKTGEREGVLPLPPEWAERWRLDQGSPPKLKVLMNFQYGERTAKHFKRSQAGYTPYDARHHYAVFGSVEYGIPIPVMAAMMGHSVTEHTNTYHRHLSKAQKRSAYRDAIKRKHQDEFVDWAGQRLSKHNPELDQHQFQRSHSHDAASSRSLSSDNLEI